MKRVRITISGEVQGVFFRKSALEKATELGLAGWVKNSGNGVLTEAEGEPISVEKYITWCYRGPEAAVVTGVETQNVAVEGDQGFIILR
jgi:acylphosphatase